MCYSLFTHCQLGKILLFFSSSRVSPFLFSSSLFSYRFKGFYFALLFTSSHLWGLSSVLSWCWSRQLASLSWWWIYSQESTCHGQITLLGRYLRSCSCVSSMVRFLYVMFASTILIAALIDFLNCISTIFGDDSWFFVTDFYKSTVVVLFSFKFTFMPLQIYPRSLVCFIFRHLLL